MHVRKPPADLAVFLCRDHAAAYDTGLERTAVILCVVLLADKGQIHAGDAEHDGAVVPVNSLPDRLCPEGRNQVHGHSQDGTGGKACVQAETVIHGDRDDHLVLMRPAHAFLHMEVDIDDPVVGEHDRLGL